jgi:hypothetical protein
MAGVVEDSEVFVSVTLKNEWREIVVNRTVINPESYFDVDLSALYSIPDSDGLPLWKSDWEEFQVPPAVLVVIYNSDPRDMTDIVSRVSNLVDYHYYPVRLRMDDDYVAEYRHNNIVVQEAQKEQGIYVLMLGIVMIAASPWIGGTSAVWGLDMIVGVYTGMSMFDHLAHATMSHANTLAIAVGAAYGNEDAALFDEEYIERFSVFHVCSDKTWDLILSEVMADIISGGLSSIASSIGKRVSSFMSRRFPTFFKKAQRALTGFAYRAGILSKVLRESADVIPEQSLAKKAIYTLAGLLGEVVFEMAFDNMVRLNKDEQPPGGPATFYALFALAIIGSAALAAAQRKSIDRFGSISPDNPRYMASLHRKAVMSLEFATGALGILQFFSRLPTMQALSHGRVPVLWHFM